MKTRKNSPAHSRFRFALLALLLLAPLRASLKDTVDMVVTASTVWGVSPTHSMEPAINEHYLLLVQYRPFHSLHLNDVILFKGSGWQDGLTVCHRVVRLSSGGSVALTKGDSNEDIDPGMVTEANYVGLVVGMVRNDLDIGAEVGQR